MSFRTYLIREYIIWKSSFRIILFKQYTIFFISTSVSNSSLTHFCIIVYISVVPPLLTHHQLSLSLCELFQTRLRDSRESSGFHDDPRESFDPSGSSSDVLPPHPMTAPVSPNVPLSASRFGAASFLPFILCYTYHDELIFSKKIYILSDRDRLTEQNYPNWSIVTNNWNTCIHWWVRERFTDLQTFRWLGIVLFEFFFKLV